MPSLRFVALLGIFAGWFAAAHAEEYERNLWPGPVTQKGPEGQSTSVEALGPLLFKKSLADGSISSGFRPLYVQSRTRDFPY